MGAQEQNMNGREQRRSRAGRRGVALIVVLGFLALMVMMAVAFLTQARTERMVAGATMEGMRGRQILRTALNAAMNDYSGDLWTADLVMPTLNYQVYESQPPPGGNTSMSRTLGNDGIDLMVGEIEDWIPRRYRTPGVTNIMRNAEWILVREDPTKVSRILGRYAYVCLDMSGGIDANLIAREPEVADNDARVASNRVRRSIRQVPMRLLPETIDGGKFKSYRKGWKGFDSLYALIHLEDGDAEDGNSTSTRWQPERKEIYGAALDTNLVSDLTPFSLSAFRGGRYDKGSGSWSSYTLIGDTTDWIKALDPVKGQFGGAVPAWVSDAIYDYTHSTAIPKGLNYPSPKNVPMFNEVQVSYRLTETANPTNAAFSIYSLRVSLTPEFWYPFPSANNVIPGTFRVEDGAGTAPTVGGGVLAPATPPNVWLQLLPIPNPTGGLLRLKLNPGALPAPLHVAAKYNAGQPYLATGTTNLVYNLDVVPEVGTDPLPANMNLRIQGATFRKDIFLTTSLGGPKADSLPTGLNFPGANLNAATTPAFSAGKAASDPRLNHDYNGQWVAESPTLGQMNTWNAAAKAKFQAEGTNLYCRNGPMDTPAELGFISTGKAEWETIDLCTPEGADMLAGLVSDTNLFYTGTKGAPAWNTNVFYTNGTININTRSTNVLASAFVDLASHEVPNVDSGLIAAQPLTEALAGTIAKAITNVTAAGTFGTAFQAGTDWARIPAMQQGGLLSADLNNNQREALIRNTWGLFNPDNSLFTVILIAQTIKEGPDGVGLWNANEDIITGERRAVALVWRDPFKTGSNLHHEMIVRMFRHLND